MIAAAITASGIYASQCVNKRIKIIESCISLIKQFSCDIEYCNMPVNELFAKAVNTQCFSDLEFLKSVYLNKSESFKDKWKASVNLFGRKNPLLKSDLILLEGFGEKLGTTDCKHQVQLCDEYIKRFSAVYDKALNRKEEHMKLCRLGGAAGAVFFIIMML